MGRPHLTVGTYGEIHVSDDGPPFIARAWFRSADGRLRHPQRSGKSQAAAKKALRDHLGELVADIHGGQLSDTTRFRVLAERWYEEIAREVDGGHRSPNTARLYRGYLDNHILPALGELRAAEVKATVCDRFLKDKADAGVKYETLKTMRAVLSGVCAYAVRNGALRDNPAKSVARLVRGEIKAVRALTAEEREDLLGKLAASERAVDFELPDLVRVMLATGVRIGELLALTGEEISADAREVTVEWHIIRVTGKGLVRRRRRKGNHEGITLRVPSWIVPVLRRRKLASGPLPLFSSTRDTWRDPSNVGHVLREEFDAAGFEWVTSHVFRKTVATMLDEAGLPTTAIADQLGNTPAVAERHYRARRAANEQMAAALERDVSEP